MLVSGLTGTASQQNRLDAHTREVSESHALRFEQHSKVANEHLTKAVQQGQNTRACAVPLPTSRSSS